MPDTQVFQEHTMAQASLGASASTPRCRTRLGEREGGWGAPGPPRATLFICCGLPSLMQQAGSGYIRAAAGAALGAAGAWQEGRA